MHCDDRFSRHVDHNDVNDTIPKFRIIRPSPDRHLKRVLEHFCFSRAVSNQHVHLSLHQDGPRQTHWHRREPKRSAGAPSSGRDDGLDRGTVFGGTHRSKARRSRSNFGLADRCTCSTCSSHFTHGCRRRTDDCSKCTSSGRAFQAARTPVTSAERPARSPRGACWAELRYPACAPVAPSSHGNDGSECPVVRVGADCTSHQPDYPPRRAKARRAE